MTKRGKNIIKTKLIILIIIIFIAILLVYKIDFNQGTDKINLLEYNRAIPVTYTLVTKETLHQYIELIADLQPITRAEISPKVAGIIENINVYLGSFVEKGTVIIKLDDDEFIENFKNAEISYNIAEASFEKQRIETENLKQNYNRSLLLYNKKLISKESFESTETKYKMALAALNNHKAQLEHEENKIRVEKLKLNYTSITAPFDGYVENIMIEKGSLVSAGRIIITMIDISKIKATMNIPEKYFYLIKPGMQAAINIMGDNSKHLGNITNVSPGVDIKTKTGRAEMTILNSENILKPGMTANTRLILNSYHNILSIPDEAIYKINNKNGVFYITEDNTVKFLMIDIIVSESGKTGIKTETEISANSKIVLLGGHLLKTGDKVIFGISQNKNVSQQMIKKMPQDS